MCGQCSRRLSGFNKLLIKIHIDYTASSKNISFFFLLGPWRRQQQQRRFLSTELIHFSILYLFFFFFIFIFISTPFIRSLLCYRVVRSLYPIMRLNLIVFLALFWDHFTSQSKKKKKDFLLHFLAFPLLPSILSFLSDNPSIV